MEIAEVERALTKAGFTVTPLGNEQIAVFHAESHVGNVTMRDECVEAFRPVFLWGLMLEALRSAGFETVEV